MEEETPIKKRQNSTLYLILLIIISGAVGVSFYYYASQFSPEIKTGVIIHHKKDVMGIEEVKTQEGPENYLDIPIPVDEPIPDLSEVIEQE